MKKKHIKIIILIASIFGGILSSHYLFSKKIEVVKNESIYYKMENDKFNLYVIFANRESQYHFKSIVPEECYENKETYILEKKISFFTSSKLEISSITLAEYIKFYKDPDWYLLYFAILFLSVCYYLVLTFLLVIKKI